MLNTLPVSSIFSFEKGTAKSLFQIIGASLLIALCSQISIPLPFNPVPITMQTFAVMVIGACLGSKKGLLAVLAYLLEGFMGFPFFVGGMSGPLVLLGLKGGYYLGFLFQVYLTGLVYDRKMTASSFKALSLFLFSCFIQMGVGTLWLSFYIGLKTAFLLGFCPFIVGEIIKSLIVASVVRTNK